MWSVLFKSGSCKVVMCTPPVCTTCMQVHMCRMQVGEGSEQWKRMRWKWAIDVHVALFLLLCPIANEILCVDNDTQCMGTALDIVGWLHTVNLRVYTVILYTDLLWWCLDMKDDLSAGRSPVLAATHVCWGLTTTKKQNDLELECCNIKLHMQTDNSLWNLIDVISGVEHFGFNQVRMFGSEET